ncbi:MAG: DEAD/DEAH box helicase family protein [Clostridiaceae bacterium]|nr:DEAD/DEAH box helicase family protein [Clostridiaceae bacterium]
MNFIKTSCIKIPEVFENEVWCQSILQDLTRTSSSYEDPSIKLITQYFEKRDGNILIPRYYEVGCYGHDVLDYTPDGIDIHFKFKRQWRNDLQRQGFEMLTQNDHGILKLPPGEGKTVVSIGAICHIGKKTIIYVHKDSLVTQWRDRFIEHSDVTIDDIGILTTDKCREILRKPIVISTVQTMNSMIDRLPDIEHVMLNAGFGVAIWDECHTTAGAPQYSRSSMYTPAKRVYGLSATPGRADQNHDIIWKHLGLVYSPEGKTNTMEPRVIMLHFSHGAKYASNYIYWGERDSNGNTKEKYPRFDNVRYFSILTSKKNKVYLSMMQKISKQIYNSNRTTLLISDRIKVLDAIGGVLPKHDIGFFIPRSKDRDSQLLKKFVLSTPGSSRDGTDRPEFDCLILANSISNIEQAAGRVCRFKVNKQQPVIFDCVDTDFEELVKRADKRKAFYQERGWIIEEKHLKA